MSSIPLVLELNDIELGVYDQQTQRLGSPGFALLESHGVITGMAARAQARIHPRHVNNQFWLRLGTDALAHARGGARHHADLAYAHLLHVHREAGAPEELIFAVPGHFSREQLAILLGIAQRCPFRASGLVDSAVAAASSVGFPRNALHIDLQLHQSVITRLAREDGVVVREAVSLVPAAGLAQMQERWARLVTSCFIQQSRFDPMHAAASEQQLYDCLPGWLERLSRQPDLRVELGNESGSYRALLRQADMIDAVRELYRQIIDEAGMTDAATTVLLSHRIAALPGFGAHLPGATLIDPMATSGACFRHHQLIRSPDAALRFITRLPAAQLPLDDGATLAPDDAELYADTARAGHGAPTHLVNGKHAFRLAHGRHAIGLDEERRWVLRGIPSQRAPATVVSDVAGCWLEPGAGVRVLRNEERLAGSARIYAGDRILIPELCDAPFWFVAEHDRSR